MGMYKYLSKTWKDSSDQAEAMWKKRLIAWRKEPAVLRIDRPTRLDRAKSLGYKAKQGVVVVRARIRRGGRKRPDFAGGRKQRSAGRVHFTPGKSLQWISEERASRKFPNMEVLNSYYLAEDGKNLWYEIILVDPSHPSTRKDKELSFLTKSVHRGRAERGLTSQGKKGRGLRNRGLGAEKLR